MVERPATIDRRQYKIIALVFGAIYVVISLIALFYIMDCVLNETMNLQEPSSVGYYDNMKVPSKMVTGIILIAVSGVFGSIAVFIYAKKLKVDSTEQQNPAERKY